MHNSILFDRLKICLQWSEHSAVSWWIIVMINKLRITLNLSNEFSSVFSMVVSVFRIQKQC